MENYFFDRHEEFFHHSGGNLPHRHQDGKIQFVTFRLCDSLPQGKIYELTDFIKEFKEKHKEPWDDLTKRVYRQFVSKLSNRLLDAGYGSCVLRDSTVREFVVSTIMYGHGKSYEVMSFVVMPNHVHLLLRPLNDSKTGDVISSIKSISARGINKYLGRSGSVWMRESYDHLVRNEAELKHCYNYIRRNPEGLPPTDFTLYPSD